MRKNNTLQKFTTTPAAPPLWTLFTVQLDPAAFDYCTRDISNLLGASMDQVRFYCNLLWPQWEGQYLMDFDQAAILIYRICRSARSIGKRSEESRAKMFAALLKRGIIDEDFPRGDPRIERAMKAIEIYRRENPTPNQSHKNLARKEKQNVH